MALALLIATAGVIGGTLCAPAIRKTYHLHRLDHAGADVRLEAMNRLAGIARRDPEVAGPLVDALLAEVASDNGAGLDAVERVAVWSIERSDAVHRRVGELLGQADEDRFVLLADWLERAGRWRPAHRSLPELARREVIRLFKADSHQRVAALEALGALGPPVGPLVGGALPAALDDPGETVREDVVRTAAVCLEVDDAVATVLLPALDDTSAAVQRAAVIHLGLLQPAALAERIRAAGPRDAGASVCRAMLWALRETRAGGELAAAVVADPDADVRRMAAWTLGFTPADDGGAAKLLRGLLGDVDPIVAARAAIAMGRRAAESNDVQGLIELSGAESADARLAALYALGRCPAEGEATGAAVSHLRATLERAIQQGWVPIAAAAMESLARLGDGPFLPVMLDVVEEFTEQPMLQYLAARAALELDREAGIDALLAVCGSDADEVRELAAFRLGLLADPSVDRLMRALRDGGDPQRGGAALALALSGTCELAAGQPLAPWLKARFDPQAAVFETSWQVRANYLAARLICGDREARPDLEVYLLNANVSRTGMFIALLATGDAQPMDMLLAEPGGIEVGSFLRDAGFAEVVGHYFPQSPASSMVWQQDVEIRRWQTQRLRDWWRVHRLRVRFDRAGGVFVNEQTNR